MKQFMRGALLTVLLLAATGTAASAAPESGAITLQNDFVTYVIAKEGALVTRVTDRAGGGDILSKNTPSPFCYLYADDMAARTLPVSAALEGGRLRVSFADGTQLEFTAEAKPEYLAFTLESPIPSAYKGLVFANTQLAYDLDGDAAFSGVGCAMTWNVDPTYYPDAKSRHVMARVLNKTGETDRPLPGSKFAAIFAPRSRHRDILKAVANDIARGEAAKSSVGGAFALDSPANFGDYMIVYTSAAANVPAWKALAATYGIDQIDFHQGARTFRQGSMRFTRQKSARNFKAHIALPLKEAGIQAGLHTYAHFICAQDKTVLTDPAWQRQLEVLETYTLKEDVSRAASMLPTIENAAEASLKDGFFDRNTVYVLVDQEIMKYTQAGPEGFMVRRGQCGTKRAAHAAGAEIRHLGGMFNMFSPDLDSELFLQVARWTAQAYNEGGFGMIYLDALDGLWSQRPPEEAWYYSAKFTNEIMRNCETDPIMECSSMSPGFWISRSRMGAWDYPQAGYKAYNRLHAEDNLAFTDCYLPTTLGWYHMYPSQDNTANRFQFFDDIDDLGALSVAYDMGMVFNPAPSATSSAAYLRNGRRFAGIYSPLRKSGYFAEDVKARVRAHPEKEFAIAEKSPGQWAFFEKKYLHSKLYDINAPGRSVITASNPFEAQKPFVRIEGHLSSGSDEGTVLLPLDFAAPLKGQTLSAILAADLDKARALRVKVVGNGSGDAICIRLTSVSVVYSNFSTSDYVIRLDFEGEREFVLAEPDNGDIGDLVFPGKAEPFIVPLYGYYREEFVFPNVTELEVFLSGDCEGVRMSGVTATAQVSNAIASPRISSGDASITFETSVGENEYLEYFPGDARATKYDGAGKATPVAVTSAGGGLPELPRGAFELGVSAANEYAANMPLRATVTLGFTGPEVEGSGGNPGAEYKPAPAVEAARPGWIIWLAAGAGAALVAGAVVVVLRGRRRRMG